MNYPLMLFLTDMGNPLPKAFQGAAEFILNTELQKALTADSLDIERIAGFLDDAIGWEVELDTQGLSYLFEKKLETMMDNFASSTENVDLLHEIIAAVELARSQTFEVNMWGVQNVFWTILQNNFEEFNVKSRQGDTQAKEWVDLFKSLGKHLSIRMD